MKVILKLIQIIYVAGSDLGTNSGSRFGIKICSIFFGVGFGSILGSSIQDYIYTNM